MNLVQFADQGGQRRVGLVEDSATLRTVDGDDGVYGMAREAISRSVSLARVVEERATDERIDYSLVVAEGRLLPPIDHPDPAHLLMTGTGLTHLGSADARDAMHKKVTSTDEESMSDSMKMFKMGVDGGKPGDGSLGVQPEWFYKGDGSTLVAPGQALGMPEFALDGGEEPEVAGVYVVAADGTPCRLGFALGNEFSDHVLEKQNYLFLAHSKLRPSAIGPELRTGPLPESVSGQVRVIRGDDVVWEDTWLSGEANMSHYISGLEHHHFKYEVFRRPGDVHVHFFGTAVLSFTAGVTCQPGDIFEIHSPDFGRPLRNSLGHLDVDGVVIVREL